MIISRFPRGVKIYTDQVANLTAVSVANTPGQINLSWTNPASKKFVGVMIRYKAGSYPTGPTDGTQAYSGAGTSASVSGLAGGTTYYFRAFAKATNTSGTKVYYNTATTGAQAAKATIASPVTSLAASYISNTPGSLTVSWTAPAGTYSNVMIRYKTGGYPTGVTDGIQAYLGTGTSATITGLTGGTQYYVRAFVVNSASEYNTNTAQQAAGYTCSSPVTGLTVVKTSVSSLTVSWAAPAGAYSNVMIRYKTGGYPTGVTDGTQAYLGVGTSVIVTGLSGGTTYYFRAFVVNAATVYNTNTSQQAYNTTKTAAGQVIFTSSQTWTVPTGVTSIDIFVVGGGGKGSRTNRGGGGGGGGGVATKKSHTVTPGQQIAVTIGAGGYGDTDEWVGTVGGATSFADVLSAAGGGAGGHRYLPEAYTSGGSGGSGGGNGAWDKNVGSVSKNGYSGGSDGLDGGHSSDQQNYFGRGSGSTTRAFGEAGNTLYAGGGGGSGHLNPTGGAREAYGGSGGSGGGGAGGSAPNSSVIIHGVAGTAGTGGGGGGGGAGLSFPNANPGSGGSGICIVRWAEQ